MSRSRTRSGRSPLRGDKKNGARLATRPGGRLFFIWCYGLAAGDAGTDPIVIFGALGCLLLGGRGPFGTGGGGSGGGQIVGSVVTVGAGAAGAAALPALPSPVGCGASMVAGVPAGGGWPAGGRGVALDARLVDGPTNASSKRSAGTVSNTVGSPASGSHGAGSVPAGRWKPITSDQRKKANAATASRNGTARAPRRAGGAGARCAAAAGAAGRSRCSPRYPGRSPGTERARISAEPLPPSCWAQPRPPRARSAPQAR